MSDPHRPATPAGTDPRDIGAVVALGLGTEQQRF